MKNGVDLILCSPPFEGSLSSGNGDEAFWEKRKELHGSRCASERRKANDLGKSYGITDGQLGAMAAGTFPFNEDNMNKETQRDCVSHEWQGCYDDSWRSLIVADAFAH